MTGRLAGHVAIVTGAGRNIGREEALLLAREGARVVVNDVDRANAAATVQVIRDDGGEAIADVNDAGSWAGAAGIVETAIDRFGRIDILINNAGVVRPMPIEQMNEATWDEVVDVSLKGYAATIRAAAPHFIAQRKGAIINTGSSSGLGHITMSNYAAAKEGALGLTRAVARDLGRYGVRCNLIRPVSFMTGMGTEEVLKSSSESRRLGYFTAGTRYFVPRADGFAPLGAHVAAFVVLLCLPAMAHVSAQDFFVKGDEIGRYREPELICSEFHPGGWTLDALENPAVLENLVGDVRNRYVSPETGHEDKP